MEEQEEQPGMICWKLEMEKFNCNVEEMDQGADILVVGGVGFGNECTSGSRTEFCGCSAGTSSTSEWFYSKVVSP